ncbi:hypothetical protein VSDG_03051 [Cytospora chrysosperma]|uniref:Uncharacterized protein n=1 Tax=Cytospora chrysosperma TaxID=252740 RepID=A0A423W8P3_CYTCH|nr:hypothetical protein VSDG_03051 [Valsa sordida]
MDCGINDTNDESITPTPPSSKGGWEAVDLPEVTASPGDLGSERQIGHNLESMSVEERCKKLMELCAKMQAQLQDSPQGEIEEGPLAEQELIPLWAGLGGWIDPLARTIMVFIASIVIFVSGLSTIVLAASLFYLGAGVIKGRFTTTPPAMDAPPFQIQPEVQATNTLLGSLPEYARKPEEALLHGEECLNQSSSQALDGFQDLNLITRKMGTKEKSHEYIALIPELDFNKAKTHKMLGCLEKWDKVKFLRVNEPRGLVVVAFASKSVWLCATQPGEGRASRQPIRFNGETIRMIPLD